MSTATNSKIPRVDSDEKYIVEGDLFRTQRRITPAVLINQYPYFDSAGNKMQRIRLRFICGHEEEFGSLDLGRGWKPRTNRQLIDDHLRITCPIAWKLCRACSEADS